MNKIKEQLKSVSQSLVSLSKRVDKLSKEVDKVQPSKKAPPKIASVKRKTAAKEAAAEKAAAGQSMTVLGSVLDAVKWSRKGTTIAALKEKTGLNSRQISNALYKLSKKGMVETKTRGLYVAK